MAEQRVPGRAEPEERLYDRGRAACLPSTFFSQLKVGKHGKSLLAYSRQMNERVRRLKRLSREKASMAPSRAEKATSFLKGYKPAPNDLVGGDPARGRPSLFRARNPEGLPVLVKAWNREGASSDSDMKDIWRSEIRQLQRLSAVPKADDLFVPMITAGSDRDGFYIVLDPGRGDPLETFRNATSKPPVLAAPRLPRNRRLLWGNFLRVARALELLHSQGIIHRNLDPWSIVG